MKAVVQQQETLRETVVRALAEDRAAEDRTSLAVVSAAARAMGRLVARENGVLAGCEYADLAFHLCDPQADVDWLQQDGDRLERGVEVMHCSGLARGLLAAERTALNFLQHLSGIASLTARAVGGAGSLTVLDTRKTTPGLREAEKAAVTAGGGSNHRRDLADEILLKENHFALSGLSYGETVGAALAAAPGLRVGAEARSLAEARAALAAGAHYVLLDNFAPAELQRVVAELRKDFPDAVLEASGGIRPENLAELAGFGLDRVSLGSLTHSAVALDLAFYVEPIARGGTA